MQVEKKESSVLAGVVPDAEWVRGAIAEAKEGPLTLNQMSLGAFINAADHGFHPQGEEMNVSEKLMLMVSELAEALEEVRDGRPLHQVRFRDGDQKPEGFLIELADAVIRIGDLCGALGLDLEGAVRLKMAFNQTRPHKHGKQF